MGPSQGKLSKLEPSYFLQLPKEATYLPSPLKKRLLSVAWGIPGLCPICLAEEVQPQQGPGSRGEDLVGILRGQNIGNGLCLLPRGLKGLAQGHLASQLVAGDNEI